MKPQYYSVTFGLLLLQSSLAFAQAHVNNYRLTIETYQGSENVVWAHDASGVDADYGNPTSKLNYYGVQTQQIQVHVDVIKPGGVSIGYWLGSGQLMGGVIRDSDWYSREKADSLGGPTLFSDTLSKVRGRDSLTFGADIKRHLDNPYIPQAYWIVGGAFIQENMDAYGVQLLADPYGNYGVPVGGYLESTDTKVLSQSTTLLALRLGLGVDMALTDKANFKAAIVGLPLVSMTGADIHYLRTDLGNPSVIQNATGIGYDTKFTMSYALAPSVAIILGYQSEAVMSLKGSATLFTDTGLPSWPYPLREFSFQREQFHLGFQYDF